MNRRIIFLTVLLAAWLSSRPEAFAEDNVKLAQTGMQFLSVVSDARAAAMAGAMTTVPLRSASLFFNPACMADMREEVDVAFSRTWWIANIQHNMVSVSFRPENGDYGVFGLSFQGVDYGDDIYGTRVDASVPQGYVDTGTLEASGMAIGLGYAKAISEPFSVGGQVRWVRQHLGESLVPVAGGGTELKKNQQGVFAFDFGTVFRTGLKSFAFGMSVRNFSREVTYEQESFPLPLTFTLGVSMDAMDFFSDRSLVNSVLVSVDAVHNRDYYEQVFFGLDCKVLDVLSVRGGYITSSDEAGFSVGAGVTKFGAAVDFAFAPFGVFDNVHRISVRFSM